MTDPNEDVKKVLVDFFKTRRANKSYRFPSPDMFLRALALAEAKLSPELYQMMKNEIVPPDPLELPGTGRPSDGCFGLPIGKPPDLATAAAFGALAWSHSEKVKENAAKRYVNLGLAIEQIEAEPAKSTERGDEDKLPAFRKTNDSWEITYEGKTIGLKDCIGLMHIRELLRNPNKPITVKELDKAYGGTENLPSGSDPGEPILDTEAKREYRERLKEIKEAEEKGTVTESQLREEESVYKELHLVQWHHKHPPKKIGDDRERTRKKVYNRFEAALKAIEKKHSSLGTHLRTCISTGSACQYNPPKDPRWTF